MTSENSTFNDIEDLKKLSQFYYLVGAISCLVFLVPLLYIVGGFIELNKAEDNFDHFFGWFDIIVGSFLFFVGQIFSLLILYFGKQISQKKKHFLSLVMAHIICLFIPFGTILGIFSLVILKRKSVKNLYS